MYFFATVSNLIKELDRKVSAVDNLADTCGHDVRFADYPTLRKELKYAMKKAYMDDSLELATIAASFAKNSAMEVEALIEEITQSAPRYEDIAHEEFIQ